MPDAAALRLLAPDAARGRRKRRRAASTQRLSVFLPRNLRRLPAPPLLRHDLATRLVLLLGFPLLRRVDISYGKTREKNGPKIT